MEYLAGRDPVAAARWIDRIDAICVRLGEQPLMGVRREDLYPGLRALPVREHIVYYSVDDHGVLVQRVLDGRRDILGLFADSD